MLIFQNPIFKYKNYSLNAIIFICKLFFTKHYCIIKQFKQCKLLFTLFIKYNVKVILPSFIKTQEILFNLNSFIIYNYCIHWFSRILFFLMEQ